MARTGRAAVAGPARSDKLGVELFGGGRPSDHGGVVARFLDAHTRATRVYSPT
jgi:hypothetical protein